MPVSGAAGYPVPNAALCTGPTHPSFYNNMGTQLPNSAAAVQQSQNVCNSLHVPWPCVQPQPHRLPTQQQMSSAQTQHIHSGATGMNPMMTFATAGHTTGTVNSNQAQMLSNQRRLQVFEHCNESWQKRGMMIVYFERLLVLSLIDAVVFIRGRQIR